jgi:ABC-2 type transport system permease protein
MALHHDRPRRFGQAALEWIEDWSPFHWLDGSVPLKNGVDLAAVVLMGLLTVVLVAVGTWGFERRDIGV